MKRFLIIIAIFCLATGCSMSIEKKAEKLAKTEVLKMLYIPESYEAVETKVDSAFSPNLDPRVLDAIMEFGEKIEELDESEREVSMSKSSMSIWSGPYMTAFGRNEYNEAKEKFEKAQAKYDKLKNQIDDIVRGLKKLKDSGVDENEKFIGYAITHTFRCKNNAGLVSLDRIYLITNEDMTKILYALDDEDSEKIKSATERLVEYFEEIE